MIEGWLGVVLAVAGSYVLGSIPTGYVAGKLRGIDIRTQGSGNLGATNVLRVLGWAAGILVLVIDISKGLAAVVWLSQLTQYPGSDLIRAACGLAAVMGHTYTCFLKFKGGKGVATACGVFLALAPFSTVAVVLVFAVVLALTRYVSAGSLTAALLLPLLVWVLGESGRDFSILILAVLMALSVLLKHRSNIGRLLNGTENRLGKPPTAAPGGGAK